MIEWVWEEEQWTVPTHVFQSRGSWPAEVPRTIRTHVWQSVGEKVEQVGGVRTIRTHLFQSAVRKIGEVDIFYLYGVGKMRPDRPWNIF